MFNYLTQTYMNTQITKLATKQLSVIEKYFIEKMGLDKFSENNVVYKLAKLLMKTHKNTGNLTGTEKIVYNALVELEEQLNEPGIYILFIGIINGLPPVTVRSSRYGSINVNQKVYVIPEKAISITLHFLVKCIYKNTKLSIKDRLKNELKNLYTNNNTSPVIKQKQAMLKLAGDAAF